MVGAEMISSLFLFPFPFYGHELTEFYITTHGFLSLSPRLHDFIYKTQYIAPLRIKLDPSRWLETFINVLSETPPPARCLSDPTETSLATTTRKAQEVTILSILWTIMYRVVFFLLFRVKNDLLVLQLFLFYSFLGRNSSETSQRAVT